MIGNRSFRAEIGEEQGWVRERGPQGEKRYSIVHVMGGKKVYYFLIPLERGRLQVLPLAYDLRKKNWYDTAASGVHHFPDRREEALDWTDRMFTFNTTCLGCHVIQLATNYDLASDTYHTVWLEPGTNCESCHGPSGEHVRAAEVLPKGEPMKDLKIIQTRTFPAERLNDLCATCHANKVENAVAHTHHQGGSSGNRCIACHMPKTDFAARTRSRQGSPSSQGPLSQPYQIEKWRRGLKNSALMQTASLEDLRPS